MKFTRIIIFLTALFFAQGLCYSQFRMPDEENPDDRNVPLAADTAKLDSVYNSISPEKKADIVRLLKAIGTYDVSQKIADWVIMNRRQVLVNVPQEFWDSLKSEINFEDWIKINTPVFDQMFTTEELKEALKFYESPVGRKFQSSIEMISAELETNEKIFGGIIHKFLMDRLDRSGYINRDEPPGN